MQGTFEESPGLTFFNWVYGAFLVDEGVTAVHVFVCTLTLTAAPFLLIH
jgi:hypothetical protein